MNNIIRTINELREETKGHTRLLYHVSYWNGPLNGMMLWEGKRAWFSLHSEDEQESWYFDVYEIPMDLIEELEAEHNLFRFYVGTHTDYDSYGRLDRGSSDWGLGGLMPYNMHDKFYKGNHTEIKVDINKYHVIGRFKL